MGLPPTGVITFSAIQTEFGGSNPIQMSEYLGAASGVPAAGELWMSNFHGKAKAVTFSPTHVAGLQNWYSADAGVTLASNVVSQWDDQSGNSRHATQPTASARPAYTTAYATNNKPAIVTGVASRLLHCASLNSTAFTIVVVMYTSQSGGFNQWLSTHGAWQSGAMHLLHLPGSRMTQISFHPSDYFPGFAFTDAQPYMIALTGQITGSSSVGYAYVNGSAYGGGMAATTWRVMRMGA